MDGRPVSLSNEIGVPMNPSPSSEEAGMSTCPNCGAVVRPDQRFCRECGTRLQGERAHIPGFPDAPESLRSSVRLGLRASNSTPSDVAPTRRGDGRPDTPGAPLAASHVTDGYSFDRDALRPGHQGTGALPPLTPSDDDDDFFSRYRRKGTSSTLTTMLSGEAPTVAAPGTHDGVAAAGGEAAGEAVASASVSEVGEDATLASSGASAPAQADAAGPANSDVPAEPSRVRFQPDVDTDHLGEPAASDAPNELPEGAARDASSVATGHPADARASDHAPETATTVFGEVPQPVAVDATPADALPRGDADGAPHADLAADVAVGADAADAADADTADTDTDVAGTDAPGAPGEQAPGEQPATAVIPVVPADEALDISADDLDADGDEDHITGLPTPMSARGSEALPSIVPADAGEDEEVAERLAQHEAEQRAAAEARRAALAPRQPGAHAFDAVVSDVDRDGEPITGVNFATTGALGRDALATSLASSESDELIRSQEDHDLFEATHEPHAPLGHGPVAPTEDAADGEQLAGTTVAGATAATGDAGTDDDADSSGPGLIGRLDAADRRRLWTILIAAGCSLLVIVSTIILGNTLTAKRGQDGPAPTASSSATPNAAQATPTPTGPPPAVANPNFQPVSFESNTGNTICVIDPKTGVACQQLKKTYDNPAEACATDAARGVAVGIDSNGTTWPCLQANLEADKKAQWDEPITAGEFTCVMNQKTGTKCTNAAGDSFVIEASNGIQVTGRKSVTSPKHSTAP